MPSIVISTLNARYHHCAFGLRYLLANMGELRDQTELIEFTINQPTLEIVDAILSKRPRILGLGVYIWNVQETLRVVSDLRRVAPDVIVILGGPEISYETDLQEICQFADYVICGEADVAFRDLCLRLTNNWLPVQGESIPGLSKSGDKRASSKPHVIQADVPDLNRLVLPYDLYSAEDIAHRVTYVEASRGCPFTCEFCLSALDIPVRQFDLKLFLDAMDQLLARGARTFKFVDRTFNLNMRTSRAILAFFLQRYQPGMFLHFELIPDRFPDALKELIVQFPAGSLQFEVGIQTFNDDVSELISRRQDNVLVEQNLRWLNGCTSVHVHADLIVGLPGESLDSFAAGFDRLVRLTPQEIQVGILKRLRGTPIIRHDDTWQMVYSPHSPYEILQTRLMDFATIQELRRFAKYWDAVANSGNFVETTALLWDSSPVRDEDSPDAAARDLESNAGPVSPFQAFRRFSRWLYECERHTHGISLSTLVEHLFEYLTGMLTLPADRVALAIWRDYRRGGRSDKPACLRPWLKEMDDPLGPAKSGGIPKRQSRRMDYAASTSDNAE